MNGKEYTTTVTLSERWADQLQRLSRGGGYESSDAIIAEALELWAESRARAEVDSDALKGAYLEGIASGPGRETTGKAFVDQLRAGQRTFG